MKKNKPTKSSPDQRLKVYQARREFDKTPEPTGSQTIGPAEHGKALRFCVQKHLASHLHYDFRLELEGVLLSWALPKGPSLDPKVKRLAIMTEDHPLDYGGFEGVIPEGYGAGIVMLWDSGTWQADEKTPDAIEAIKKGEIKFHLAGQKLKGTWTLVRTRGFGGQKNSWLMMKRSDEWATAEDVTQSAQLSVKSGGDFANILAQAKAELWESYISGKNAAGELASEIIQQAIEIRASQARDGR
jgi:bifunctional non-homologous end joining protein LigD